MGSDDDAIDRRNDAMSHGDQAWEEWWAWLGRAPDPLVWKDRRPTAALDLEAMRDHLDRVKRVAVDKELRIRHDAAMTTTATDHEVAGIERLGVLPEPLVTYIKWNHKAWGPEDNGEVQPFDFEPGFWDTLSAVGMPTALSDRAAIWAEESTRRGVPLIPMEDVESRLPATQALPLGVEGRIVPKAQSQVGAGAVKKTPRGGQKAAAARARAAQRANTPKTTGE